MEYGSLTQEVTYLGCTHFESSVEKLLYLLRSFINLPQSFQVYATDATYSCPVHGTKP
jgi:hypothetical protein